MKPSFVLFVEFNGDKIAIECNGERIELWIEDAKKLADDIQTIVSQKN